MGREPQSLDAPTLVLPAPHVGVVLATHRRPQLMRRALESILEQDYPGAITVLVVHDKCDPDESLALEGDRRQVMPVANSRTPGLAGARNTGILGLATDFVAFCDDDDTWFPEKLTRQIAALQDNPEAEFCSTAMSVDYSGTASVRLAGKAEVTYEDLLRSRMAMVHSSSFVIRRDALLSTIGLVDEEIPNSMCEDWDLLLRAARRKPILHVDSPLVRVFWGGSSYFYEQWEVKNRAHLWMLEHHPDILSSPVGKSRVFGQLAFGHAALGNRREAFRWAGRSLRANWREPRAVLALGVAGGVVSDRRIVDRLQRHGHGI
ncbi:glycosyltransferase family 2 protein [Arthrobacter zhaoguopingii]|uniref:glycosyltransferase family 2 protein n=1 Tax=Arthrobacter zhaoguopingii TaxID=2681491 RepID=UPI001FEC795F|nr:glycosyltransferase family A protein [Arthrobacter zhaoguopingii]